MLSFAVKTAVASLKNIGMDYRPGHWSCGMEGWHHTGCHSRSCGAGQQLWLFVSCLVVAVLVCADGIRDVQKPDDWKAKADCRVTVTPGQQQNEVQVILWEPADVPVNQVVDLGMDVMRTLGVQGLLMKVYDCGADIPTICARMEAAMRTTVPGLTGRYLLPPNPVPPHLAVRLRPRRSNLYTPGSNAYMLRKAGSSRADGVIFDLEGCAASLLQ